ncbi:MAG: WxL domain-containing protein [Enterococcus gilvus]|uniref:WxL domain-containing protein n=1 Tax=Enterococcus gilvus TaxID=160453 RepID=UPI0039F5F053
MKAKKILVGILSTTLVGGILISGAAAQAATYGGTSDANAKFKAGDIITPPVTPPVVPPVTPPASDFGLLYTPTEFNFKETQVRSTPGTYSIEIDPTWEIAEPGANPLKKHVGMGDVRGTQAGWKLEAELNAWSTGAVGNITGSEIQIDTTELQEIIDPSLDAPTGIGAIVSTAQAPDITPTSITLAPGTAAVVMSASNTKGQGYWDTGMEDITLEVPATANPIAGETYTSTVDWTLTDAP